MTPLYTAENCSSAFQLNWSLSVFGAAEFPPRSEWLEKLQAGRRAGIVGGRRKDLVAG